MQLPADLSARIAESRARHLSPAIGAVWATRIGGIGVVEHGESAAGGSLWHIGSCTKAMTATLIARLVAQGVFQYETPLVEALPDLARSMHPGFREIPLSRVLTHQAGIAENPAPSTFRALRRSTAPVAAQRRFLATEALRVQPRLGTAYSNLGYIVLGAVIEQATGRDWEAALARGVMIPLGIARFGFGSPGRGNPAGHRRVSDRWVRETSDNPAAYGPAGRVHLALDEWGRFLRAHLGGGTVLGSEALARLHRPAENGFAMGWIAGQRRDTEYLLHTGSNTAWFAQATLVPSRGVALGIVCNAYDVRIEEAVGVLSRSLLGFEEEGPP